MQKVLISRCLTGEGCRYDGKASKLCRLNELSQLCSLVAVCPEVMGGLDTPRSPSEIKNGRVISKDGKDVTAQFERGALLALETAKKHGCTLAILKSKSPSCGYGEIYDGSFSSVLTEGNGITARLFEQNGIAIFNENNVDEIIAYLEEKSEHNS